MLCVADFVGKILGKLFVNIITCVVHIKDEFSKQLKV